MSFQPLTIRTAALAAGLAAAQLTLPSTLPAQESGARVRLTTMARPSTWITGQVALETPDSLAIITPAEAHSARDTRTVFHASASNGDAVPQAPQADTVWLARTEVRRLEVSRGRKSNAGRGALIGAGVGFGLGLVIFTGAMTSSDCDGAEGWCAAGAGVVGAGLALTGAGLGALIGSASHRDRWESVPLTPAVGAGHNGGVRVGLSFDF